MNHAEQQITKLAIDLYDAAAETGDHFTTAELVDQLYDDLVRRFGDEQSAVDDLIRIAADKAIKRVDRERTKPVEQPSLGEDLDRVLPVGKAQRRIRRRMDGSDWAAHLALVADNAARVNAAAAKEQKRYAELSPYLARGLDTEDALAAWQVEHPDEVLS